MKPRYAIVNEYERDKFEKEWQLPYGYGNCFVSTDPKEAISELERACNIAETTGRDCTSDIVEKISEKGRELYYRI